jgi:hypothetical protein
MESIDPLMSLVINLIGSENDKNRNNAQMILSKEFIAITRSSGKEENREMLLKSIEKGSEKNPNIVRIMDKEYKVVENGHLGIVRSKVITKNPEGNYRNLHIFRKENDHWKCIIWQVTELKEN